MGNSSLCYFRIESAKNRIEGKVEENILKKDFVFNNKYIIEYKDKTLFISNNDNYIEDFFSIGNTENNCINITSIIGKNGAGKTVTMALLNEFVYSNRYIDIDAIIVFMINNKFVIIAPKGLIDNVNKEGINAEYKIYYYKDKEINKVEEMHQVIDKLREIYKEIYKEITTIYFSNVVSIRNTLISSTDDSKNYFNISLDSDLQLSFKRNSIVMNEYWINDKYIDTRFDGRYYQMIANHRSEKNIKFIVEGKNSFDIPIIEMKLNIYNNDRTNIINPPLRDKVRIYDEFREEERKGRIVVTPTKSEQKIYELLTKEFKQKETLIIKREEKAQKELALNIINLAIIDKYFNELYSKLNNYKVIKLINERIEEKVGENFTDYKEGFKLIQDLLGKISETTLTEIYVKVIGVDNKKVTASVATKQCIEFIQDINKRYIKIFEEIEEIFNNPNIEIGTAKTIYSSDNRQYYNYEPFIIIKEKAYEQLYKAISNANEVTELFYFKYKGLSSGQQALLDMYSEFYYIKEKIKTNSILVLIDEPELYFHPEWQRRLITILIDYFNRYFPNKKVQIIFTSNSPYTLSDLPKDNVIMLGKNDNNINTFASNIHTLLKEKYFMNSTMGELARTKIQKLVNDINENIDNPQRITEMKQITDMIGEELLKNKIKEMMNDLNDQNK